MGEGRNEMADICGQQDGVDGSMAVPYRRRRSVHFGRFIRNLMAVAILIGSFASIGVVTSATPSGAAVTKVDHTAALKHAPLRTSGSGTKSDVIKPLVAGCPDPQAIVGITEYETHPNGGNFEGYWDAGGDGGVFAFPTPNSNTVWYNSLPGENICPSAPIVGIADTADSGGYWLLGSDGTVYGFGDAVVYQGSIAGHSGAFVAITATADGKGYWLLDSTGQRYTFGDAQYWSGTDAGASGPFVGMAATPDGQGFWVIDSTGQRYTFGDAQYWPGSDSGYTGSIVNITSDGSAGFWVLDRRNSQDLWMRI